MFGFGKKKPDETWVSAPAEVLEAQRDRWAITHGSDAVVSNTQLQWKLRLMVRPGDRPPFEAQVRTALPQLVTPGVGTTMMVRFDPGDPSRVEVDKSEAAQREAAIQGVLQNSPRLASVAIAGKSMDELLHEAMRDPAAFREQMHRLGADPNAASMVQGPPGMQVLFGGSDGFQPVGDLAAARADATPPVLPDDHIAQLERIAGLRDRGVLTEDEFQAEKRRILGG